MDAELARLLADYWPALGAAAFLLLGVYWCARFLALTFESVGDAFGPLGDYWRAKRAITEAERLDMISRITYLDGQVRALRYRDACYFSYMLYDQEWHRRHELLAAERGWTFEKHVSFLEFRDRWMTDRGFKDEWTEIWT